MKNLIYNFLLAFICIPLISLFVNAEYIFVSNENSDTIAVLDLKLSKTN